MTDARPEFIPARPRRGFVHVMEWLNRLVALPLLKIIVDLRDEDLARLKAIPRGIGVVVACNHPSFPDPLVVGEVARRWGRICTYMAAREIFNKFGGWMGSVIRRGGAFSVFRGGANRVASEFAQRTLHAARFPIVVFPEGHTFYLNDELLPLKHGVAAWAVDAAAARDAPPVVVVPMAIKYRYVEDIRELLDASVAQMERAVLRRTSPVPPGEFWTRLYLRLFRLADVILTYQERHHHYHPPPGADLDERVQGLCANLLRTLEIRHLGKEREGDFFDRARYLMARLRDDDHPEHQQDALDARFAWALSTFHAGYLAPDSSPERFAETVMKLRREITHRVPITFRAWRRARVRVGEPLAVAHYLPGSGTVFDEAARRPAIERLLADLSAALRTMIDEMVVEPSR